ncbi:bifunctional MaoC family dehydratase/OB-fold nucleic acid binding domain-containing protein [Streptomyces sp. BH-SS-21]|uniref:Bifunctional MaoC family dehydratase/OB-fold nucleic acid binding domain-containing protein n=1 Tax=Streptomyces liliiviolaceus TaxID=2823109 RepID=A0A941B507_9ACTN|nr:bifunctional MaoC family dehydratase/OB-fold nucleic acid binding domain-containing protein [Streptomyces liliiviolaceus]
MPGGRGTSGEGAVSVDATEGGYEDIHARLKTYEGLTAVGGVGKDLVNEPMIRHWCEAMGDTNPAYAGADAVAPATMLQAWTMGGLSGHGGRSEAYVEMLGLLDSAGYVSVVATDCEQEYLRPLRPGDRITFDSVIESVSERKTTKLGTGYFVTTRTDVRAEGEPAGTHRFRILKYVPAGRRRKDGATAGVATAAGETTADARETAADAGETAADAGKAPAPTGAAVATTRAAVAPAGETVAASRAKRPRPVVNRDNAGFWDGVSRHRLLIQRCEKCRTLRFPWLPGCNSCGCLEWDTVEAAGEGTVYSYVVMHHPPFPAFDPPYAVGLVELSEGVRMISNVVGVPHDRVRIGMPVRLEFERVDEELELPVFRAVEGSGG